MGSLIGMDLFAQGLAGLDLYSYGKERSHLCLMHQEWYLTTNTDMINSKESGAS